MLCVPAVNALVEHAAVRVLPEPLNATDEQPEMAFPASLKATDPVGLVPVTLAVNVTLCPCVDGFSELASVVVVAPGAAAFTVCDNAELADVTFAPSPL